MRRDVRALAWMTVALPLVAGACTSSHAGGIPLATPSFSMTVATDSGGPPTAEEPTRFKLVVHDRETGQPVEGGQGRIFASSKDGVKVDDGLAKGKEVGTYYGVMMFPISGDWAMAVEFRRDSTKRLERDDWQMTVKSAKPGYGS